MPAPNNKNSKQNGKGLDVPALESWLWDAACTIRGPLDAPKFKDYILPLIFLKRLSDVFDDEVTHLAKDFGDPATAAKLVKQDHKLVGFFIPEKARWPKIAAVTTGLGQFLTDAVRAVARENPRLSGVIDVTDFNATAAGQRIVDDQHLTNLVQVLNNPECRLGLDDVEPDILGRAYEYLLRKFAEGQGQSAGEFYTPKEVGWLIAHLLDPKPYTTVYDPTCGSAGLLIKARLLFEQKNPTQKSKAPKLYGQEMNPVTFAMAKMNMFLHDYTDSFFAIGDTFTKPGFAAEGAGLKRFDYVVANPMWNQDNYGEAFYEKDNWNRFTNGVPPASSADWGWLQHIAASLNDAGRAAVVLDTGTVSRGSGSKSSNKEKTIRQAFVQADLIEAVVLLPDNLFYNTTAPGIIVVLNRHKNNGRKGQFLLINASAFFVKKKPKNELTDAGIAAVAEV